MIINILHNYNFFKFGIFIFFNTLQFSLVIYIPTKLFLYLYLFLIISIMAIIY
jgi:hypothetical protein